MHASASSLNPASEPAACAAGVATDPPGAAVEIRDVWLIHGLWNAAWWLAPLAWRLRRAGFRVRLFGYASIFGGPEPAIRALADKLRDGPPCHVVGHSLGGMVALEAVRRTPALPVRRLVCLGSPLAGSRTAGTLAQRGAAGWVLGRSASLLQSGCPSWRGGTQVGMVAGDVARGMGRLLAAVGTDSDGTVALDETRWDGLSDHCRVHSSHTGLVFSPEAARQVAAFLLTGSFLAGTDGSGMRGAGPV